ncbi:RICIN domain-containing protein [Streptomyces sp. PsTaAH-124]|nr:RICIN domain-containing protein [Streptomyces sp. PsTaAH-124]
MSSDSAAQTVQVSPSLPTESVTTSRKNSTDTSGAGKKDPDAKATSTRSAPAARPVGGSSKPERPEEKDTARTQAGAGESRAQSPESTRARSTESKGVLSSLASLAPRGSARRAGSGTRDVDTAAESSATATAASSRASSPGNTRDPDIRSRTSTGRKGGGSVSADADADADGAARRPAGRPGARALLRGSHRTVLTVAAVTGVVLVAGVLVGLRGGGAQDTAAPDPAASLFEPGEDGGSRGSVPGAIPLPTGHKSGSPSAAPTGGGPASHGAKKAAAAAVAADGGTSDSSSKSSSSSHDGGKTGSGSSSSSSSTHHSASTSSTTGTNSSTSTGGSTSPGGASGSGGSAAPGVMVFSHASGRCITVTGGQGKDGSPLQIRDCSGSTAQKWTFASDGTIRAFGLCMDAAGASTANGTVVQLAKCNGGPAQQFRLNARHDLTNVMANQCVDVKDQSTANGTRLQLWTCAGTGNQKWSKK